MRKKIKKRYSGRFNVSGGGHNPLGYVLLVLAAVVTLFFGYRAATKNLSLFQGEYTLYIARVDYITSVETTQFDNADSGITETTEASFLATVLYGSRKGEVLTGEQYLDSGDYGSNIVIKVGDRVLLQDNDSSVYTMTGFFRTDVIVIAAVIFAVLLLIFGGLRGLSSIISLTLSLLSVFLFFIPAILSCFNVYLCAVLVCLYNILLTPLLIGGFTKKSLASILGCSGGVAIAAGVALLLDHLMRLSGMVDEDMMYVSLLITQSRLDLNGIVFGAVLIGALGATIDVSMSIASPTMELSETKQMSFSQLLSSALNIGRDIMGAQTSTLVLAYVGCSLATVLVLVCNRSSFIEIINLERIATDMLEALVGAFAILFTIPATALATSLLCTRNASAQEIDYDA